MSPGAGGRRTVDRAPIGVGPEAVRELVAEVAHAGRRADLEALLALFATETGEAPAVWATGIAGFGTMRYRYASGHGGTSFRVGVAVRGTELTLHLSLHLAARPDLLARLGRHRAGAGCLYLRSLAEVDREVLRELVRAGYAGTIAAFPDST